MLRRFNVKNFMSFTCKEDGKTEEFSMIPGKVRSNKDHLLTVEDHSLLKFAAIYGANASGKSNIIKAIACMKKIILSNSSAEYTNKYSRIGEGNEKKPSYFETELVINGKRFTYGFEVVLNESRFVSEWLVELISDDEENVIFSRDIENKEDFINEEWKNDEFLYTRLQIYFEDTENGLLLYTMNQIKGMFYFKFPSVKIIQKVYKWFEKDLIITKPDQPVNGLSYFSLDQNMNKAVELIRSFATGISDYRLNTISPEDLFNIVPAHIRINIEKALDSHKKNIAPLIKFLDANPDLNASLQNINNDTGKMNVIVKNMDRLFIVTIEGRDSDLSCTEIRFIHSDNNGFDFGEESDGTQRLWDLLEIFYADGNTTFFIDEIDRCLHPSLTYKLIKTFFEQTENRNVQLIVTTHESRLLDFNLLRRDEIWFVDKRKSGESDIYSLEEYNERYDKKIDKAYLEGRYGGVPVFTSVFPVEEDKE